jgi:hypothetical protein
VRNAKMKYFLIFTLFVSVFGLDLNKMCREKLFKALPHPNNTNLFIGCVQGRGTLLSCAAEDEVFDPFLISCVNSEAPVNPEHVKLCENIVFGLFPHSGNCWQFVICQNSRPYLTSCPENNVFNPALPGCVSGNVDRCDVYFHTTPAPTILPETTEPPPKTTPRTTTPRNDGSGVIIDFNCPVSGFGNIPHPNDCSRYFECSRGVRFSRTCPVDTIFDVISSNCNNIDISLCAVGIQCKESSS